MTGLAALTLVMLLDGASGVADPAALRRERDEAVRRVEEIVNQPVTGVPVTPGANPRMYPGWFHEGASQPDFNRVDVRSGQNLAYDAYPWVASNDNPGVMYRGADLEFNRWTKVFYKDRSLPKKKLTEAEMVEINRLYRIIGRVDAALIEPAPEPPATVSPMLLGALAAALALVGLLVWRRRSA
jgi:hypothetical protein